MKISFSEQLAHELDECSAAMIKSGSNTGKVHELGMVVVRDGSPEYHERAQFDGYIFYTFEKCGVIFHVALC